MAVYTFHEVLVWDIGSGGSVRYARNSRVAVIDPATGTTPAGLTQGGVAVTSLMSDADGTLDFTTTDVPTVILTAPSGIERRVTSQDAIESAAGFTVSEDAAVSALVNNPASSTQGALDSWVNAHGDARWISQTAGDARWQRNLGVISAKTYGAVGDGVTDDTTAIQNALTAAVAGQTVLIPQGGNYKVSGAGLTFGAAGGRVVCEGTLLAATADMTVLTITGDGIDVVPRINGNGVGRDGVKVLGAGCTVRDGLIEDLYSATGGPRGVWVETTGGVTVSGNTIRTIDAPGNASTGDYNGAARAIVVTHASAPTGNTIIRDNHISSIMGEEGDAIQVLFGASPFPNGRTTIVGNVVDTVSRRMVKVQAAGTVVRGNVYRHTGGDPGASAAALIDVIHSADCDVRDNVLDATYFMGVQLSGPAALVGNIVVQGNTVNAGTGKVGIYLDLVTACTVSGNVVSRGSVGIWAQNVTDSTITDNVCKGTTTVNSSIRALSTCSGMIISRNLGYGGARDWLVQNDAPGSIVENNHARWSSGTGGGIRVTATATGSSYRDNTATPGPGVYGGGTPMANMLVGQSRGNSATQAGDVIWTSASPATEHSTTAHTKGTVAFSTAPVAAGKVGWVCTASGTPGTWKPFGVIDT